MARAHQRKQSARPKTVESLLSEELENLSIEKRKANADENVKSTNLTRKQMSASLHSSFDEKKEDANNLVEVGGYKENMGKATVMANESSRHQENAPYGYTKNVHRKISKSESLLNMEQDELAMSLSTAKFKLLKNANLERVKAEDKLPEYEDVKHLKNMNNKKVKNIKRDNDAFRDMPEQIYDKMPSDTFKEIPDDVFENIPRAVTARVQNREKRKPVVKSREDIFENKQEDYTASAPALDANDNRKEENGDPTSVGFIAMLFTGAPNRPANNMDQVESDFMFALFIQKQEEEAANRDRNTAPKPIHDPSVGHFCAPHLPGFCEANFCIFHTSGPPPS